MEDGTVQVVTRDGRHGVFDKHGRWLSGDAKQADPHLCLWIGGKELPNRFQLAADAAQGTTGSDPAGGADANDRHRAGPPGPPAPLPRRRATRTCSTATADRRTCRSSCAGRATSTSAAPTSRAPATSAATSTSSRRSGCGSKVWQMACREEDIPEVGDTLVYEICDLSILVVRPAPDEIKAFYNACLHRGRQLQGARTATTTSCAARSTASAGTSTAR